MALRRVGSLCWVVATLGVFAALSPEAAALDAGLEEAFLETLPERDADGNRIDPQTYDADENGIVDLAHVRLLDFVLATPSAPRHALILGAYTLNLIQVQRDNTLRPQCPILEPILGFKCANLEKLIAGIITIGEESAITPLLEEAARYGIRIDLNNYNLSAARYLTAAGDLDGDGFSNLAEYEAVCRRFDPFVQAATTRSLTPDTVPCCGDCPVVLTREPEDAWRYVEQNHTFIAEATGGDGPLAYQWTKDGQPIGTGAPALALLLLQPADAGVYACTVTDGVRSATTRGARLVVGTPLAIGAQPQGAARFEGESHVFSVGIAGGLPPITYEWRKNGQPIGENSPDLRLDNLTAADAGNYWCRVRDRFQTTLTQTAVLSVAPVVVPEGEPDGEPGGEGEPEGEPPCFVEIVLDLPDGLQVDLQPAVEWPCGGVALLRAFPDPGWVFVQWLGPVDDPFAPETTLPLPEQPGTLVIGAVVDPLPDPEGEGEDPEGEPEGLEEGEDEGGDDDFPADVRLSGDAEVGIDFGVIRPGAAAETTIRVFNIGLDAVAVRGDLFLGVHFALAEPLDAIIPPLSSLPVTIQYLPGGRGVHTDVLVVETPFGPRYAHLIGRGGFKPVAACGAAPDAPAGRVGDLIAVLACAALLLCAAARGSRRHEGGSVRRLWKASGRI